MQKLYYTILGEGINGPVSVAGAADAAWEFPGGDKNGFRFMLLKAEPELPDCTLTEMTAELPIQMGEQEFLFMNGFQSWSYCPEQTRKGRTRGINGLPKPLVNHYGLDRYADYYFTKYPNKPGIMQGVSYCYFRDGDKYRLIASLDEEPGYTYFSYNAKLNKLTVRRDCEGLRVNGTYKALDLYFAVGSEQEVFDGWFDAMDIRPRTKESVTGYSSWYNRYENISQETILSDLEGAAAILKPGDLFQIDDGWEKAVGDWEADPVKFPDGMKAMADVIHEKGFKAGLWLAPFAAAEKSSIYEEHPQWFYFYKHEPWFAGCNWDGFYALDMDHPEVRDYLKKVFRRVFDEWGFDLVKLDFLYAAAPFGSAKETRAGRQIRAMRFLRELCGDKLILGCGVPLMPVFGLFDYCRISCDVGLDWNDTVIMQRTNRERVSTKQAIENAIYRRQLDGRAFGADPDVFYLRDENIKLTADEKKLLAINCALFGTMHLCSDDMGTFTDAKRDAWARLRQIAKEAKDIRVSHTLDEKGKEKLSVLYHLGETGYTYDVPLK